MLLVSSLVLLFFIEIPNGYFKLTAHLFLENIRFHGRSSIRHQLLALASLHPMIRFFFPTACCRFICVARMFHVVGNILPFLWSR